MRLHRFVKIFALVGVLLCSLSVKAAEYYIGRCNGEVAYDGLGLRQAATLECATKLSSDLWTKYVGDAIKGVRVGLSSNTNAFPETITVWVREAYNGANLAEATVNVNGTGGWKQGTFDSPVTIQSGKNYYVGYTYTQTSYCYIISTVGSDFDGGLHLSVNGQWQNYSSNGFGGLSAEAVIDSENAPKNDLAFSNVSLKSSGVLTDSDILVNMTVENKATLTQNGFSVEYTIGGKTAKVDYTDVIAYRESKDVEMTIPTKGLNLSGTNNLELKLVCAGGAADEAESDNIAKLEVNVFSKGYARNILLEQFSTEMCGNCPAGQASLNEAYSMLVDKQSRAFWVTHHVGYYTDWLTNPASSSYTWFFGSGSTYAPACMLNRSYLPSICTGQYPATGISQPAVMSAAMLSEMDVLSPVMVDVNVVKNAAGEYVIKVSGERSPEFEQICSGARVSVMVTEDGITSTSQAGNTGTYTHNHVLRQMCCSSNWGDLIYWENDKFEISYTVTPQDSWVEGNLKAIAFVSAFSDNRNGCKVYNVAGTTMPIGEAAVESIEGDAEVVSTRWVDMNGRQCSQADVPGVWVKIDTLADGSTKTSKVIVK